MVALESTTSRDPGFQKAAWVWLGKVPGSRREAARGAALVAGAAFNNAGRPAFREDVVRISAGF